MISRGHVDRGDLTEAQLDAALDVLAIERTAEYQGLYHVLHGVIPSVRGHV